MSVMFGHGAFMDELRRRRGKVPTDLYGDLVAAQAVQMNQLEGRVDTLEGYHRDSAR